MPVSPLSLPQTPRSAAAAYQGISVVKMMADVMVENAEKGCDFDDLRAAGFTAAEILSHQANASAAAHAIMNKSIQRAKASGDKAVAKMTGIVFVLLPGVLEIVLHLQQRGFTKDQIDLHLGGAMAAAADQFAAMGGAQ